MTKRILALAAAAALAACSGSKGDKGDTGPQGPQGPAGPGGGGGTGAVGAAGTGLQYKITSATATAGAAPTVTFTVTDAAGNPLTLKSGTTLAWTPNFTIAKLGADGKWTSYLTRQVAGKPYRVVDPASALIFPNVAAPGVPLVTVQPAATAPVTQAASEAVTADRLTAGSAAGTYTYTFAAPLQGFDPAATTRIGVYGTRTAPDTGVAYPGSTTLDFVPAGGTPTSHEVVTDDACARCHAVVRAHGDARLGVKLCLTCHTSQTVDPETNSSVEMETMIHKIHTGSNLTKGYTVVGFAPNNPATLPVTAVHPFGDGGMAPSHSSYLERTAAGTGVIGATAVNDPGIVRDCQLCHQGAQAANYHADTAVTRQNCTTCHDGLNLDGGTSTQLNGNTFTHPQIPLPASGTDTACAACHAGTSPVAGIDIRHSQGFETTRNVQFPEYPRDTLAAGTPTHTWDVKITGVRNAVPGQAPAIDFTLALDGQPFDGLTIPPAANGRQISIGSLGFQLAGPVETDHAETWPTVGGAASALNASTTTPAGTFVPGTLNPARVTAGTAPGTFTFTFATALPATAKPGTYVASFESYVRETVIDAVNGFVSKPYAATPVFHGANKNVAYVTMSSGAASSVERRVVVSDAKCNTCHEVLGFHGDRARRGPDYCATCHDPNFSNAGRARFVDSTVAPAPNAALPQTRAFAGLAKVFVAESVSLNVFIHRIHMGAELPSVQAGGSYVLGAARTATLNTPEAWAAANNGEEALSNFSDFDSPGPVLRCATCHEGQSYGLPPSDKRLPVKRAVLDCPGTETSPSGAWCTGRTPNATQPALYIPPITAVCTSCHDAPATIAHARLNTIFPPTSLRTAGDFDTYNPYIGSTDPLVPNPANTAIESCATCHGAGKDLDPLKVHQGPAFLSGLAASP